MTAILDHVREDVKFGDLSIGSERTRGPSYRRRDVRARLFGLLRKNPLDCVIQIGVEVALINEFYAARAVSIAWRAFGVATDVLR